MVSNTLITNGDFSTYETIKQIAGPHPGVGFWFIFPVHRQEQFRYVAVQRRATTGQSTLEITELEIMV